jgi:hypothetical protein
MAVIWPGALLLVALLQPASLEAAPATDDLRQSAVELGAEVDRQRGGATLAEIDALLARIDALGGRASHERHARELLAGEDEAALERLYRSPTWSDIGFARAAARYWSSWLRLDRNRLNQQPDDLHAARHGFQATLPLIVYPGLVRGSWLGLGFVELAEQNYDAARAWFETVALGDDALASTAQKELALVEALQSSVVAPGSVVNMAPATADAMEAEALALLERHGKTADGAIAAAQRFRALEAAGYMSVNRTERLMVYRDEIIGHDIGPVGFLVSADNALEHQQNFTAVQKYRQFFAALDVPRRERFARYRLDFADALLRSGLVSEAAMQLDDKLIGHLANQQDVESLRHVAAAVRYAENGTDPARAELLAAQMAARDRGADFTRQLLSADPAAARRSWQLARREKDPWIARLPLFELTYRELLRTPDQPALAGGFAKLGLELFDRLPRSTSREFWASIAQVEMLGFSQQDVDAFLHSLDKLSVKGHQAQIDRNLSARLYGVRIRYLMRMDGARLVSELGDLSPPLDDSIVVVLMSHLLDCDEHAWCVPVTERLAELLADRPNQLLFVVLQHIRLLAASGDDIGAYQQAAALVARQPDSGDAWQAYAVAAREVGRSGDADHAYSRIVASVPVGSDPWRLTLLEQLKGRLASGATDAACALRIKAYRDRKTGQEADSLLTAAAVRC